MEVSARDIGGRKTILYDPVTVDTCHQTFLKRRRRHNPKSEPSWEPGLSLITCQYWLINCNKCTLLVRDLMKGESGRFGEEEQVCRNPLGSVLPETLKLLQELKRKVLHPHPDATREDDHCRAQRSGGDRKRENLLLGPCVLWKPQLHDLCLEDLSPRMSQVTFTPLFTSVFCVSVYGTPVSTHTSKTSGHNTKPNRKKKG